LPACVVLLGLNLAAFLAYTLPRGIQERTLATRAASLKDEVQAGRRLASDLRRNAETLRANAADLERFYREVLQTRRRALLATLEEIEEMASGPGLKPGPRSFKPQEVKGMPLTRVVVALPLSGTYAQLVGFLERVEHSPRLLTVERVSISRGRGDRPDEANLSVQMSAYFRAEEGGGGG
jgi:Tfp pilus assembly protein PilO